MKPENLSKRQEYIFVDPIRGQARLARFLSQEGDLFKFLVDNRELLLIPDQVEGIEERTEYMKKSATRMGPAKRVLSKSVNSNSVFD